MAVKWYKTLNNRNDIGFSPVSVKGIFSIQCRSFQLFVVNNQGGEETSVLNYLCIIGSPVDAATNMSDFKRVGIDRIVIGAAEGSTQSYLGPVPRSLFQD